MHVKKAVNTGVTFDCMSQSMAGHERRRASPPTNGAGPVARKAEGCCVGIFSLR